MWIRIQIRIRNTDNYKTLCCVQVLENIELNKKSLYSRVPGCQITTYYYVGYVLVLLQSTMFFYIPEILSYLLEGLAVPKSNK